MLRGFDKLLEFSSFLFSQYGDQNNPQSLKGLKELYFSIQFDAMQNYCHDLPTS
jgi:hypothetical protein